METRTDADSRSLADLVAQLEGRIRAAAARFSLDESDVDEVIQDVRIRIWKARGESPSVGGTPEAYVYRTAMSAALDLTRRRRRRITEELPLSAPGRESDRPERMLADKETAAAIEVALSSLSDRRRPVVRMYLAGHGSGEIATLMGWSEAKARNLLYRGLSDLRAALADLGIGPSGHASSDRGREAAGEASRRTDPVGRPAPHPSGGEV